MTLNADSLIPAPMFWPLNCSRRYFFSFCFQYFSSYHSFPLERLYYPRSGNLDPLSTLSLYGLVLVYHRGWRWNMWPRPGQARHITPCPGTELWLKLSSPSDSEIFWGLWESCSSCPDCMYSNVRAWFFQRIPMQKPQWRKTITEGNFLNMLRDKVLITVTPD